MRYRELIETPIGNFELHGMDRPGTFPDVDRRLLNDPKHVRKIRKRFANCPFNFDLYFINREQQPYIDIDNTFSRAWEVDLMRYGGEAEPKKIKALTGVDIDPSPDAITVVFLSNANAEDTINMTPWIVAHRLGHALLDNTNGLPIPSWEDSATASVPLALWRTLTMRSARQGKVQEGEEQAEMIAQFIITGGVKLRVPEYAISVRLLTPEEHQIAVRELAETERDINQAIADYLKVRVGHMFVAL